MAAHPSLGRANPLLATLAPMVISRRTSNRFTSGSRHRLNFAKSRMFWAVRLFLCACRADDRRDFYPILAKELIRL
jgi:hypothetical protein